MPENSYVMIDENGKAFKIETRIYLFGVENVTWTVNSFDEMLRHPTSLREYTADEIGVVLCQDLVQIKMRSSVS